MLQMTIIEEEFYFWPIWYGQNLTIIHKNIRIYQIKFV